MNEWETYLVNVGSRVGGILKSKQTTTDQNQSQYEIIEIWRCDDWVDFFSYTEKKEKFQFEDLKQKNHVFIHIESCNFSTLMIDIQSKNFKDIFLLKPSRIKALKSL